MKTIFWSQNYHPTDDDTLIVDSKETNKLTSEEIEEAHNILKQFACDSMLVTDSQKVCSTYNVPANFKIWIHPRKGIMLQSSFNKRDMSNRPIPFVIWHYKIDTDEFIRILMESLKFSNNAIADGEADIYKKILKDIIAYRFRIVLLLVLILILIVSSIICLIVY